MSNVQYKCEPCNHSVSALPNTDVAVMCRSNKGSECTLVQVDDFPEHVAKSYVKEPKAKTAAKTEKAATKMVTPPSGGSK